MTRDELQKLVLEGWSLQEMAVHYGVSRSSIAKWIKAFGIIRTEEDRRRAYERGLRMREQGRLCRLHGLPPGSAIPDGGDESAPDLYEIARRREAAIGSEMLRLAMVRLNERLRAQAAGQSAGSVGLAAGAGDSARKSSS